MKLSKVEHPSAGEVVFDRISGFLSSEQEDNIQEYFLNNGFPWFYQLNSVDSPEDSVFDDFGFHTHNFLMKGNPQSPFLQDVINKVKLGRFMNEYKVGDNLEVYNAHANLVLQRDRNVISHPHIDFRNYKHTVILYYINDCDGDTIFYNLSDCDDHRLDELEVWRRETPKKGDIVIFDGRIFHSPSCPVKSAYRSTLNFDFLIDTL